MLYFCILWWLNFTIIVKIYIFSPAPCFLFLKEEILKEDSYLSVLHWTVFLNSSSFNVLNSYFSYNVCKLVLWNTTWFDVNEHITCNNNLYIIVISADRSGYGTQCSARCSTGCTLYSSPTLLWKLTLPPGCTWLLSLKVTIFNKNLRLFSS